MRKSLEHEEKVKLACDGQQIELMSFQLKRDVEERKKMDQDEAIMNVDTSDMNPELQAYYHYRTSLQMDSRRDANYTNLIYKQSNLEEQFIMESSGQGSQSSQFPIQMGSAINKPGGGNFTTEEDTLLVLAWLNISRDAVRGNQQKDSTFWSRVLEYFNKYKKFASDHTQNSLMLQWSTIELAIDKFCGCFAQIEFRHQSGVNEQDKINEAKLMYHSLYNTQFQFIHCWNVMRQHPKWFVDCRKKKPMRNKTAPPASSSSSMVNLINLGGDDISNDSFVDLERPPGRKAKKEQLNGRKRKDRQNDHTSSLALKLLRELMERIQKKEKFKQKKREIKERLYLLREERFAIELEKLRLEQEKEDHRIMSMDLSEMSPMKTTYYRHRQMQILAKRAGS